MLVLDNTRRGSCNIRMRKNLEKKSVSFYSKNLHIFSGKVSEFFLEHPTDTK